MMILGSAAVGCGSVESGRHPQQQGSKGENRSFHVGHPFIKGIGPQFVRAVTDSPGGMRGTCSPASAMRRFSRSASSARTCARAGSATRLLRIVRVACQVVEEVFDVVVAVGVAARRRSGARTLYVQRSVRIARPTWLSLIWTKTSSGQSWPCRRRAAERTAPHGAGRRHASGGEEGRGHVDQADKSSTTRPPVKPGPQATIGIRRAGVVARPVCIRRSACGSGSRGRWYRRPVCSRSYRTGSVVADPAEVGVEAMDAAEVVGVVWPPVAFRPDSGRRGRRSRRNRSLAARGPSKWLWSF